MNFGRVQGIFRNIPFNMGVPAATVLAQLCTHNGRLPQGASTSPVLSNLASTTLDKKLVQIAKKYHLTYTRYADDITFSSNKPFPHSIVEKEELENGEYKHKVGIFLERSIKSSGFNINHSKTRLQHKSQRQEVTGLVVNEGVNINRKFIRKTRAMIHDWRKDLLEAEKRFIKIRYHAKESELNASKLDGSIYKRAVYGNLSFIKMVKGEEHSPYLTLCKQVLELDNTPPDFVGKLKGIFDMYDIFICHASEDKNEVALPLYESLKQRKINAFIDCFSIGWGDSLVAKINTALQKSKYVIAIISEDSVNKSWPMKELNAVLSAEISSEQTKLLPLMVGDGEALIEKLPLLADKLFVSYDNNINEIAEKVEAHLAKE
ncbi:TIR domain-containing protein [Psychromonas sp. MME2]|uniref:TIR domain-containing protein n=1 Tax=Psychromonas sp. MME2 TaxID=3231033 RepID=UPI00339BE29B